MALVRAVVLVQTVLITLVMTEVFVLVETRLVMALMPVRVTNAKVVTAIVMEVVRRAVMLFALQILLAQLVRGVVILTMGLVIRIVMAVILLVTETVTVVVMVLIPASVM